MIGMTAWQTRAAALYRPSIVHRSLPSPSARLPSIHRPFPHSWTVCPPPRSLESPSSAVRCLPSTFVYSFPIRGRSPSARIESPPSTVRRPPSTVFPVLRRPRSAICRPHSFIRFPFVDGLPSSPKPRKPILRRPQSAVHIRLFVPHSLTVCPPPRSLESLSSAVRCLPSIHRPRSAPPSIPPSAVCDPPSTFVYSFPIR
jgi:hypothetical protein